MPIKIDYMVQLWQKGDYFLAYAMPIDVMSGGKTEEEARHALEEAVGLSLKRAADMGTLEQVLEDAGYVLHDNEWEGPTWISVKRHTLSVVVQLVPRLLLSKGWQFVRQADNHCSY